jgi:hypothetical protein
MRKTATGWGIDSQISIAVFHGEPLLHLFSSRASTAFRETKQSSVVLVIDILDGQRNCWR